MILTSPSSKYTPWGDWLPELKYGVLWTFLNQLANTPSHLNRGTALPQYRDSGNNSLAESAPVLSAVWRLLSSGRLPFCNLNSKLCRDPSDFYVQSKQDNKFPARTWGETYCPKFIKFKLLARKWNFRRPIPPPPLLHNTPPPPILRKISPVTITIDRNIFL